MHICFEDLPVVPLDQFYGGKGCLRAAMHQDSQIKIMHGTLPPNCSIGQHRHWTSSELIYVLSGTATISFDDITEVVTAGQCHYCPVGHRHAMRNNGETDLQFIAVVPEQCHLREV